MYLQHQTKYIPCILNHAYCICYRNHNIINGFHQQAWIHHFRFCFTSSKLPNITVILQTSVGYDKIDQQKKAFNDIVVYVSLTRLPNASWIIMYSVIASSQFQLKLNQVSLLFSFLKLQDIHEKYNLFYICCLALAVKKQAQALHGVTERISIEDVTLRM